MGDVSGRLRSRRGRVDRVYLSSHRAVEGIFLAMSILSTNLATESSKVAVRSSREEPKELP